MVNFSLLDDKPSPSDLPVVDSDDALLDVLVGQENTSAITDLERVVCFFVARGQSFEQACSKLGLQPDLADKLKQREELMQLVMQIQTALKLPLHEQLKSLAPLALQRKMELVMFSKNEAVVNAASSFIIEQAEGRATQKVEVQSFNLNARAEMDEVDTALQATQDRLAVIQAERQRLLEAKEKAS